jgi:hypothetical protein
MTRRSLILVLAPVLLVAAGCGTKPLNENKTYTLDTSTSGHRLDIPATNKARTITVEFSSSDKDVTVLLLKKSDVKDGEDGITTAEGAKKLGGKRAKADSFTAELPADTAGTIIVREHAAAKTEVTLKVTSAP